MKKNNLGSLKAERKQSRILKVSELIKRTLAEIFLSESFTDTRMRTFTIFVSEVSLSSDMRSAIVFITHFCPSNIIDDGTIIQTLEKKLFKIRKKLGEKIGLRYTPKLKFKIDSLGSESQKVEKILDDLKVKDAE